MGVGSITLGGIADRFGRRPAILLCLSLMAVGMLAAALAQDLYVLSVYRFATGLGIGGMLASTNAMVAEFSNRRQRSMLVTFMAGGFPLGIIVGGSVASELLQHGDWRWIFYFGAAATAVLWLVCARYLPESVAFLVAKPSPQRLQQLNKILQKMGRETLASLPKAKRENEITSPAPALLSATLRRVTVALSLAYFAHIMTHYFFLKWVPKIVVDLGNDASSAGGVLVWANVGGLLSSLLMGIASHRFAIGKLTQMVLLSCAVTIAVFGSVVGSLLALTLIAAVAGFFTQAAVVGLYALIAEHFPTAVRASGTGWVIGIGRGGAALGPIVAGMLFSWGFSLQWVALLMAAGSLLAFAAIALILRPR